MKILERVKSFFKRNVKKQTVRIDEKLTEWLKNTYKDSMAFKSAPTGSNYYVVKTNGKSIKIRLSNHTEVFNSCNLYIQTAVNNPGIVIIREKSDRTVYVCTYGEAVDYIRKYIHNNGKVVKAAKKIIELPDIYVDYDALVYHKISDNNKFSKHAAISANWKEFKAWYANVLTFGISELPTLYQSRMHDIFTMKMDYNKVHYILLNNMKEARNVYVGIDNTYNGIKNGKYANFVLDDGNINIVSKAAAKKHMPPHNVAILDTIVNKNELPWEVEIAKLELLAGNIGYSGLSDDDKKKLEYIFTYPMSAHLRYDLFATNYNAFACDAHVAIRKTLEQMGDPSDVYDINTISRKTFIRYKMVNTTYMNSVFFTKLPEIGVQWNNKHYRIKHFGTWYEMMTVMFPWLLDLPGRYKDSIRQMSEKEVGYIRIIEALIIANEKSDRHSCSRMLDMARKILTANEYENMWYDFETNTVYDIADDTVLHECKVDPNVPFFTKLRDYDMLWESSEYRVNNIDRWIKMMSKMFPWMADSMYRPKLKYIAGLDVQGGTKRIIEYLLISHNDSPNRMKSNTLKNVISMINSNSSRRWEFKSNTIAGISPINADNTPFVYHYDKPEVIISKDEWLDLCDKRTENIGKLRDCLIKDVNHYIKFTTKQQEIVMDLMSNDIPYSVCIKTINECFNTTKTLQNGCNKLKRQYCA